MSVDLVSLVPVLRDIAEQCPFPYHNICHTTGVIKRVRDIIKKVESPLPERTADMLIYAAAYHDYGHCGQTVRQTCTRDVPAKDVSNEEYAARVAVEQLKDVFEPHELAEVANIILATSFGQSNPSFAYYRTYKPITLPEKILAFADIAGYVNGFEMWIEENFFVLLESSLENLPPDFESWQKGRLGFIDYMRSKLAELRSSLSVAYFDNLSSKLYRIQTELTITIEQHRETFEKIRASRIKELT
jgi:hypothetical protein